MFGLLSSDYFLHEEPTFYFQRHESVKVIFSLKDFQSFGADLFRSFGSRARQRVVHLWRQFIGDGPTNGKCGKLTRCNYVGINLPICEE